MGDDETEKAHRHYGYISSRPRHKQRFSNTSVLLLVLLSHCSVYFCVCCYCTCRLISNHALKGSSVDSTKPSQLYIAAHDKFNMRPASFNRLTPLPFITDLGTVLFPLPVTVGCSVGCSQSSQNNIFLIGFSNLIELRVVVFHVIEILNHLFYGGLDLYYSFI